MADATAGGTLLTVSTSVYFSGETSVTTLALLDGFDNYANASDLASEYATVGNVNVNATGGPFGTRCAELAVNGGTLFKQLPQSFTQGWQGFWHRRDRVGGLPSESVIACWCSGAGVVEVCFTLDNAMGLLRAYRGNRATLLATAPRLVPNPQTLFHWYDFGVKFDGANGWIEVWCDGVPMLQVSGVNTKQTSAEALTGPMIGSPGADATVLRYDDWAASLGNRIGVLRIAPLAPNSDAGPNVGTPSTGTDHFAVVDEAIYNTTDYLTLTNVGGNRELFGLTDLPANASKVHGVRVTAVAQKSGTAGAYRMQAVAKSGASEFVGDPAPLPAGTLWTTVSTVLPKNPSGASWTVADVNALLAGAQVSVI